MHTNMQTPPVYNHRGHAYMNMHTHIHAWKLPSNQIVRRFSHHSIEGLTTKKTNTHTHTYTHTLYMSVHTHTHKHTLIDAHTRMHTNKSYTHKHTHTHIYTQIHVHT